MATCTRTTSSSLLLPRQRQDPLRFRRHRELRPDGQLLLDLGANDNCDYVDPDTSQTRNWAGMVRRPSDECISCAGCAHSQCLNCQLKGKVFWWMMARMAGWSGQ